MTARTADLVRMTCLFTAWALTSGHGRKCHAAKPLLRPLGGRRRWQSWVELTRNGGSLLYLGWPLYEIRGVDDLEYVVNGETVTTLMVGDPAERDGTDPHALDEYMDGLDFAGDSASAEVTSALRLIGRITGRELDRAWLDERHMRFTIPAVAR
ncbi:hypothetical protein [Sinosporangium album]|uniref:hypothetical protein n=1 Tax=Sinosporangium album TaxID=504805 RepID=UPI0015A3C40A|nr:hypothetical protein [Sinosporangium album]